MNTTHINILAGREPVGSLHEFAEVFFNKIIRVPAFEERESSNYVDGYYFTATTEMRTYKVMLTSDEKHMDLPYWIHVGTTEDTKPLTMAEIDALAHALNCHGFRAARVVKYGQPAEARFDYLSPDKR